MKDAFVLEIGFEELPARHCLSIIKQLNEDTLKELLTKNNLSFSGPHLHVTPRRLAFHASSAEQITSEVEVKGPLATVAYKDGKPTDVAKKFAKAQGVKVDELTKKKQKGKEFVFAKKDLSDEFTANVQSFVDGMLSRISIDKPMRWDGSGMKFSRPIRWILCLHGKRVIELLIGNVISDKITYGPRFLGSNEFAISHASHYEDTLAKHKVIVDHVKRKALILKLLEKIDLTQNLKTDDPDESLVDETTFLTEYPQPIFCSFDKRFLDLPEEVISTVLIKHQKYFPLINKKTDEMTHSFLVIANYDKESELIKKGNEKVVNARLRDGVFFYELDQKMKLAEFAKKTDKITFQEDLGSMMDKTKRMEKIAKELSSLFTVDAQKLSAAVLLSKADLATNMVNEFPSLEGTMGSIYARNEKMDKDVARSLTEYYHPRFSTDRLPNGDLGTLLALAERIDTLYGLFGLGFRPKGNSDPYGLRRTGIAIVRILWEKEIDVPLSEVIDAGAKAHKVKVDPGEMDLFLLNRLEQYLRDIPVKEEMLNTNFIRAVVFNKTPSLKNKRSIHDELKKLYKDKKFTQFLELAKRIYNISVKNSNRSDYSIKKTTLNDSENSFYSAIEDLTAKDALSLSDVFSLTEPGTTFFEKNMVMSKDKDEQARRLEILWLAYEQISRVLQIEYILS